MSTAELLAHLRHLDIQIWAEGDRLRFRAPSGALSDELRAALAEHKTALLAFLRQAQGPAEETARPIPRLPADGPLPLSFGQQRLWFLDQLEPGNPRYNMPFAMRLDGPLDPGALGRALSEIVRRHAVLRTSFTQADGQPVQRIGPAEALPLPLVDLRGLPASAREARVLELAGAEFQHAFDLGRGPLVRASLLRLDEHAHVLLLCVHHIAFDGWSYGVFVRELAALYAAFVDGSPAPLPEPPVQYADFAAWQRERLDGQAAAQLDYWRGRLDGLPRLALPRDGQSAPGRTRGATRSATLPAPVVAALQRLAREGEATPFMAVLAVFKLLLARLTGQSDIAVGTPIAGRPRPEVERLIGFFLNTLVLRTDLAGADTFRALLGRVRETALGAYANQDVPFERLVEQLQPDRDLERAPFFDVLFNYVTETPDQTLAPGLTLRLEELDEQESKFPMTLYAAQRGGELRLTLVYQSALFSEARAAALLDQLCLLAGQIAAAPDAPLEAHTLVTPTARAVLPDPQAALPAPPQRPVPELILEQAERLPGHAAVRQSGRSHSYAELAGRARALAAALVARGLGRGDTVAVTGGRSFGLIAGMLAALLAGGRLLTLDPRLPAERRLLMLRASGARLLLCAGRQPPADLDGLPLAALLVDPDSALADGEATALPAIRPEDPAYIFFTSGTTGVPKAVAGWHGGLSHFVAWQRETFAIGPDDRAAQLTGLSFDVVLRDVFTPLTAGATLCLPDDEDDLAGARLLPWLERERITMVHTVPALAQSWLADVPAGVGLAALRLVFFAGEPLRDALVRRWRAAFPAAGAVVNLYGPTETTLAKCFYRVPAEPDPGVQPVGAPLPQTQALVLSPSGRLCGVGEIGEIAIRTPFRSRGYLNAPEEQARRFVPSPFTGDPADLVYLTGDRGRYRPDGALEILGRVDHQIKIRGVRIEPEEIAALLARHPSVRACAVVAQPSGQDDYALVAYIVPAEEPERESTKDTKGANGSGHEDAELKTQNSKLRTFLSERLPEYMVPAAFVALDALPLTPNGKLDRRALPPADLSRPAGRAERVAPRTPVEEIVAEIWSEVLGVRPVGAEDHFFEIGGHSLLATLVASRIGQAFKTSLPVRAVFEAPTVALLAQRLVAGEPRPGQTEKIALLLKRIKGMSAEDRRQTLQQTAAR